MLFLAFAILGACQEPERFENHFDKPGAKEFSVEAVCSVDANSVKCWDLDGNDAPKSAEDLDGSLRLHHEEVNFRFGKTNRMIVVRIGVAADGYPAAMLDSNRLSMSAWQDPHFGGRYLLSRTKTFVREGYAVSAGYDVKTLEIPFVYYTPATNPFHLKCERWFRTDDGDHKLTCIFCGPYQNPYVGPEGDPRGPSWEIRIGTVGVNPQSELNSIPLDSHGTRIEALDRNGAPTPATKLSEDLIEVHRQIENGNPTPRQNFRAAYWEPYRDQAGVLVIHTNIDPSKISDLQVTLKLGTLAMLAGIPLNPKPAGTSP